MKLKRLALVLAMVYTSCLSAQVTLEHDYPVIADTVSGPVLIEIAAHEHKWLVHEWSQSSFSLYNMDHSVFMAHIQPTIPLYQPPHNYEPIYVTRSLFDCDSTNIEFAIAAVEVDTGDMQFTITRTDGTVLFSENNATVPYCFGCGVGSTYIQGINNTESGAKLQLIIWNGVPGHLRHKIYSLCGDLPLGILAPMPPTSALVYPNPSNTGYTIILPERSSAGMNRVIVHDGSGATVIDQAFRGDSVWIEANALPYAEGLYFYQIISASGRTYAGKLVRMR